MRSTGITRPVDRLGRIVIPAEIRETLKLDEGDRMEIFVDDGNIMLRKYFNGCMCCGNINNLVHSYRLTMCRNCINDFKEKLEVLERENALENPLNYVYEEGKDD